MSDIILNLISFISGGISIGGLLVAVEKKYRLCNQIRKNWAKFRNKDIQGTINLIYKTDLKDLKSIKQIVSNEFRREGIQFNKETTNELSFNSGLFNMHFYLGQLKDLNFQVKDFSFGIQNASERIDNLIDSINKITNEVNNTKFDSCEIDLLLPYNLENLEINPPKELQVKQYKIELTHKRQNSLSITLSLNNDRRLMKLNSNNSTALKSFIRRVI